MQACAWLLVFGLMAVNCSAQSSDTARYNLRFSTTGFVNRTNDGSAYLLNNNLRLGIQTNKIEANASGGWVYGRQESGLTNNDFSTAIDFNLLKEQRRLYYWGLLTYDKSYSLSIHNRLQAGAGAGYTLINKRTVVLVLSDGPLYESADLYDTAYITLRNSFRLKYEVIVAKIIVLEGTNFLQSSVFDATDYVVKAMNNISVKLNSWLSITASTTYNKLNLVAKENLLVNFGFRIDRRF